MSIVWDKKGLKHIDDSLRKALMASGDLLQDEIREEQVIPRMDGTLSGEAFVVNKNNAGKGVLRFEFNTRYARRLYFHPEYHFHKEPWTDSKGYHHDGAPNAQGEWMRHWLAGGKYQDRPSKILAGALKKLV